VNADILLARANWFDERYRGGANHRFRADPVTAIEMEDEVVPAVTEILDKGQYLDAAQIVSKIPAFAKGQDQLIATVLPLTAQFRESSLYPRICGRFALASRLAGSGRKP
jgi:hypothetical protein